MAKLPLLQPGEFYTFRRYFELPYDLEDILAEFGVALERSPMTLPQSTRAIDDSALKHQIQTNLLYVDLTNEAARREVLIAPILLYLCQLTQAKLKIEYPINVNNFLRGNVDYYLQTQETLLVVEAKQADLSKGFTQLAVELIALDQWTVLEVPMLYGAVTTGDIWKFGVLHRQEKKIWQDINLYRAPTDLQELLTILVGILLPS